MFKMYLKFNKLNFKSKKLHHIKNSNKIEICSKLKIPQINYQNEVKIKWRQNHIFNKSDDFSTSVVTGPK